MKKQWSLPSLIKFGKSSGTLFCFCIFLFCCNTRFSLYGLIFFAFASEDKIGKTTAGTKAESRNFLLNTFSGCNVELSCTLSIQTNTPLRRILKWNDYPFKKRMSLLHVILLVFISASMSWFSLSLYSTRKFRCQTE